MIINELRRLAQAAMTEPDGVSLNWVKLLQDFQKEANPATVSELLDRLEAAESDALEQARLNGMGASREAALMAKLEAAENEVAHIKEVEFPRKVRAVAVGWETKCARLEQERDNANAAAAGIALQAETLQAERDELLARIDKLNVQNSAMLKALLAIADWNSAWGPFPEKNEHWRAMAIVTAREATKAFEQGEQK